MEYARIREDDVGGDVMSAMEFWQRWEKSPDKVYDSEFVYEVIGCWISSWWVDQSAVGRPVSELFHTVKEPTGFHDSKGQLFSKSETLRRIKQNALTINDHKVTADLILTRGLLIKDIWAVLRSGKKLGGNYLLVGIEPEGENYVAELQDINRQLEEEREHTLQLQWAEEDFVSARRDYEKAQEKMKQAGLRLQELRKND